MSAPPYTFDYTLEDLHNPRGKNNLSARSKFYQRSLYKEAIYPHEDMSPNPHDIPHPLDTWYNKNLYGRVDRCQNTITPITKFLSPVRLATGPDIMCLDFVEMAFHAFANNMKTAYITGCLDKSGNRDLWDVKAVMGYTDPTQKWLTFIDATIDSFINSHIDRAGKTIKNYKDFIPIFRDYIMYVATTYSVTKENFLLSTVVSPFISGLTLSISGTSADDDRLKYKDFINDPNFDFYVKAAKKFGFIVNKNMPWMLTADLFTNAIKRYYTYYRIHLNSEIYDIDESLLFDAFYKRTYKSAFDSLRYIFARGYTRLVEKRPLYTEQKVIFDKNCAPRKEHIIDPIANPGLDPVQSILSTAYFRENNAHRQELMLTEAENIIGNDFLIDLYVDLRHTESKESYPDVISVRRRAYEIYRAPIHSGAPGPNTLTPLRQVLDYINGIYRAYVYPSNYGSVTSLLNLDSHSVKNLPDTGAEIAAGNVCDMGVLPWNDFGHADMEDLLAAESSP